MTIEIKDEEIKELEEEIKDEEKEDVASALEKDIKKNEEIEVKQNKKEKKEAKKKEKKELRKQKNNETKEKVKEGFNLYKFIIEVIITVVLIAFAITIFIDKEHASFLIILISGGVTVFAAILRLFGLLKKDTNPFVRKASLIIYILHLILGIYLIIAAFVYNSEINSNEGISKFSKFNNENYPYFLSAILYTQAVMFFWKSIIHKVPTGKFIFWLNIFLVTIAVLMVAFAKDLTANKIVVALGIIILLCALIIGIDAGVGYYHFRNGNSKPKSKKKDEDVEEDKIDAPAKDIDPSSIGDKDDRNRPMIS